MKCLTLFSLMLTASQGTVPLKPAKPLDPKDAGSVLEHAAFNTRSQGSYETKFKARLTTSGAPLDYEGNCVWVHPGVLFVHYTASGGDEKMIVRAGDKDVWIWNSLVGWVTADEAGMAGAGRGIQNPDEVLSVVARHSGGAKLTKSGVVELNFSGDDIEKIMREQASRGAFLWNQSSARLEVIVDGENRLQRFTCDATLRPSDPAVKGTVGYTADVTLVGYNGARELKFYDEKKREIPLRPDMKQRIETVLKEKN
jgi:hypothetical protein